jgi:hypothetical protein
MATVFLLGILVSLSQSADPHVIESHEIEITDPLSGSDFLLISKAAQHREMRNRDLSCYDIFVTTESGVRTVSFAGKREALPPVGAGEVDLRFTKENPRCPDRSFEMDQNGHVKRVIYARH